MNENVRRYFHSRPSTSETGGRFFKAVALHDDENASWEVLAQGLPELPRGWFELSRLTSEDRVEFLKGYWDTQLPYSPHLSGKVDRFFEDLDDIGVYLTQRNEGDPFVPQLVYARKGGSGFFHGYPPASKGEIESLRAACMPDELPADFLAFLQIHNGFRKADDTGVLRISKIGAKREDVRQQIEAGPPLTFSNGEVLNSRHLIPFYQSYGMEVFQCFYADWYPEQEMGNLYYSGNENFISDYRKPGTNAEKQAFPTFLDWLLFYLESVPV